MGLSIPSSFLGVPLFSHLLRLFVCRPVVFDRQAISTYFWESCWFRPFWGDLPPACTRWPSWWENMHRQKDKIVRPSTQGQEELLISMSSLRPRHLPIVGREQCRTGSLNHTVGGSRTVMKGVSRPTLELTWFAGPITSVLYQDLGGWFYFGELGRTFEGRMCSWWR